LFKFSRVVNRYVVDHKHRVWARPRIHDLNELASKLVEYLGRHGAFEYVEMYDTLKRECRKDGVSGI
jgi:hypothetical protein